MIFIEILLFVISVIPYSVHAQDEITVCEHILKNRAERLPLQGFVYIEELNKHIMFYDDKVYEFIFKYKDNRPRIIVVSGGVRVEHYFDGVFLRNGATIFNAYGLTNRTTKIIFVVTHKDLLSPPVLSDQDNTMLYESLTGFIYDVSVREAIEYDNSKLPYNFPYVFFSDNKEKLFLHQFHQYSFFPLNTRYSAEDTLNFPNMHFFTANQYEFNLSSRTVSLSELPTPESKYLEIFKTKMVLVSAFGFKENIYFITRDDVYFLKESDFESRLSPSAEFFHRVNKIPISKFLTCTNMALYETMDYSGIFNATLWVVFFFCLLGLCCIPLRYFLYESILTRGYRKKRHHGHTVFTTRTPSMTREEGTSLPAPRPLIHTTGDRVYRSKYYQSPEVLAESLIDREGMPLTMVIENPGNADETMTFVNKPIDSPSDSSCTSNVASMIRKNSSKLRLPSRVHRDRSKPAVTLPPMPNPRPPSRIPVSKTNSRTMESQLSLPDIKSGAGT